MKKSKQISKRKSNNGGIYIFLIVLSLSVGSLLGYSLYLSNTLYEYKEDHWVNSFPSERLQSHFDRCYTTSKKIVNEEYVNKCTYQLNDGWLITVDIDSSTDNSDWNDTFILTLKEESPGASPKNVTFRMNSECKDIPREVYKSINVCERGIDWGNYGGGIKNEN